MTTELKIALSLPEINTILAALGERPYAEVFELVSKIHSQAQGQLGNENSNAVSTGESQP